MRIQITGRHVGVTEAMKDYAREKVEKLERLYGRMTGVEVTMEGGTDRKVVEMVADATGLPVGIKSAVGNLEFWHLLAEGMADRQRGVDFITIDEAGTVPSRGHFGVRVWSSTTWVAVVEARHDFVDAIVVEVIDSGGVPPALIAI